MFGNIGDIILEGPRRGKGMVDCPKGRLEGVLHFHHHLPHVVCREEITRSLGRAGGVAGVVGVAGVSRGVLKETEFLSKCPKEVVYFAV